MKRTGRQTATAETTRPVRMWRDDANWIRRQAFEREVPAAVVVAEILAFYREHTGNRTEVDG